MKKLNLVFLGDSITAGVVAGPVLDYREKGYAQYIRDYFELHGRLGTYHNFAVSGFMTRDVVKQLRDNITHNENIAFNILSEKCYRMTKKQVGHDTIKFTHPDISISNAIQNADMIVMTCGANDLIRLFKKFREGNAADLVRSLFKHEYTDETLEEALHNYFVIMEYITSLNPNVEILLMANYLPTADQGLNDRLYEKFSNLEDALYDPIAERYHQNVKLIKPRELFKENKEQYITSWIDIHPSDIGHRALADLALSNQDLINYNYHMLLENK